MLKSAERSRTAKIDGPGRSLHGLEGNHFVAVAAQVDCRAVGHGPDVRKTAHVPAGTSITSKSLCTAEARRQFGHFDAIHHVFLNKVNEAIECFNHSHSFQYQSSRMPEAGTRLSLSESVAN